MPNTPQRQRLDLSQFYSFQLQRKKKRKKTKPNQTKCVNKEQIMQREKENSMWG